mgnify:FL=1
MNIQRYDPAVHDDRDEHGVNYFAEMEPDPSGEWVRFSDVHAVLAKFAAFAGPDGEPRKWVGRPTLDKHGRLIGLGSVFTVHCDEVIECRLVLMPDDEIKGNALAFEMDDDEDEVDELHDLFPTKQAAEAAAGGKK